ncbi:RAMP superfamily CRISPR-associated protein [Tahibacter caeni]|uniref:RAMP superfamily CRISPR-associated protein n=1 Tax=Tahibacter caeni TaxID=1453545 RepID=UPI0021473ECC|nr:RAMP superfamily CRISPR-associated protein [Tahibacter caeni]
MAKKYKSAKVKRPPVGGPGRAPIATSGNGNERIRRVITAEFLSDAHPGSGSGGGGIDALIARDRHGRPVIWASHLEGVLRDAARRLRGDEEAEAFFGRAGGDFARNDRQRAVFTSLYAKDDRTSHIWRSSARAAFDNRAPKDDTLRVVEYVPKGTRLAGEVELPANELPVLQRLLQEVDALGGGRASGAGRVRFALSETPATMPQPGLPAGRLVLVLKNLDPLCITATATPGNLIPSLAFVPGRTLLGAVAAWLIAEGNREAASLLTSGRISVSDALPLPQAPANLAGVAVLPAPLTLQSTKPQGVAGDVPWWAQAHTGTPRLDAWNTNREKLKRPADDLFVYRAGPGAPWTAFRPPRRVRLRNGRPDPAQADTSLFAIEQIAEETYFLAELRGEQEDMTRLAQKLRPVLEERRWLRVGRGGAPVAVAQLAWSAAPTAEKTGDRALLTLTADLLVRDEHLRWRTVLDHAALQALVGGDIRLGRSLQDSVMVHGFNGTSRLWRMPAAAIRRGSVFEISGPGVAALAARAAQGRWLGERIHEGFGRFRLDTTLPGAAGEAGASAALAPPADAGEETAAATTCDWFAGHRTLANAGGSGDRKPSLSQWLDLVTELDRNGTNALESRINPTTAGGRSWGHADANAILLKLAALPTTQRAAHARLFVRWLRAEMRKEAK